MDSTPNPLASPPELTPLEQEVLDEYERLAENMKKVGARIPHSITATNPRRVSGPALLTNLRQQLASILDSLAGRPSTEILDGLRELERKTSLVFTLLKASVYSIVLQQEIDWGDQASQ
jgi:DASH complex subunit DAD3